MARAKATRGAKFRAAMQASYDDLRIDELELVEEGARLLDLVDDLDGAIKAAGFVATGSAGQTVAHPLLGTLQAARSELRRLLNQLRLPEPAPEDGDE